MSRKVLALLIVVIAIIGSIIGWRVYRSRTNHRANVVRVGYKPNSGYQHFFIAQDKGFFKNHQLEVDGVSFESTNQMVQAMVNGDIDATAASSIEVLALVQQNSPDLFKIYLTLVFDKDNAFHSLLVPANSNIQKLSDLKGKRIGTNPGSTSQSWFLRWHDLRHTFGTKLGDAGYPESTIAQLMGHATVEMAFRYTHATEHGKRAAVEAARIARPAVCHNPATDDQRPVLLATVSG